jgi:peptide methionine sulfoxide reductase msrA/msrB
MNAPQKYALLGCGLMIALLGFFSKTESTEIKSSQEENAMSKTEKEGSVFARIIDTDGNLTEPVLTPKFILTDSEWKERLTPEQFRIMRTQGTEPAFCGGLLKNKEVGLYLCQGCNLPLFFSESKFESGTGWPSFFEPVGATNILERPDNSYGMVRTEILCPRCESHLGHVFPDGPPPTGLRYCLNSESLKFVASTDLKSVGEAVKKEGEVAVAVIAGGCFWCVEGVFEQIDGVLDVESGYSGGTAETANYEAVCSGRTAHAEAVRIVYDPSKVSYEKLLEVHFATHDPTTLNRQGNDAGPQYRSTIFYSDDVQKQAAEKTIAHLTEEKKFRNPIVTTLEPLTEFYPAEPYHQDYVCRNPDNPYIRAVAQPKVEKVREKFQELIRDSLTTTP